MFNTFSRRQFLAVAAAAAVVPTTSMALTESQARTLVDRLVSDINAIIASGKSCARDRAVAGSALCGCSDHRPDRNGR